MSDPPDAEPRRDTQSTAKLLHVFAGYLSAEFPELHHVEMWRFGQAVTAFLQLQASNPVLDAEPAPVPASPAGAEDQTVLEVLNGLIGLVQLIMYRPDISAEVRHHLLTSHRFIAAMALSDKSAARAASVCREAAQDLYSEGVAVGLELGKQLHAAVEIEEWRCLKCGGVLLERVPVVEQAAHVTGDGTPHPNCPRCKGTGEGDNAQFSCICRWHNRGCAMVQHGQDCDCRKCPQPVPSTDVLDACLASEAFKSAMEAYRNAQTIRPFGERELADAYAEVTRLIHEAVANQPASPAGGPLRALVATWRQRADTEPDECASYAFNRCADDLDAALAVASGSGEAAFTCNARHSPTDPPQDCDWPHCGCDPCAQKVLDALSEEEAAMMRLQERVDALATALYVAGIRSSDKDGLPRLIAEGVLLNLRKVQGVDLYRVRGGQLPSAALAVASPSAPDLRQQGREDVLELLAPDVAHDLRLDLKMPTSRDAFADRPLHPSYLVARLDALTAERDTLKTELDALRGSAPSPSAPAWQPDDLITHARRLVDYCGGGSPSGDVAFDEMLHHLEQALPPPPASPSQA